MDGPIDDWQEGPGLVDSIRRYRWLVASITLLAAVAAFVWSSTQPVQYQGVVRLYLDTSGDQTDPGRIVRSQAEFITSPEVLDRTITLDGNRMSRKELEQRLTVEPARDADVITITVLDATRAQAGALAESVARAYRESVARQSAAAAKQEVAALNQRQEQLAGEIDTLDAQLADDPGNQRLLAIRQAKEDQLAKLADQVEAARDGASWAATPGRDGEGVGHRPRGPGPAQAAAQRRPRRHAGAGRLGRAGLVAERAGAEPAPAGVAPRGRPRRGPPRARALAPARGFRRDSRQITGNGSPAGNGSASGITDFDQVATSIQ